jgi:hypothetical protein
MARIKLFHLVHRYNQATRQLESAPLSDYMSSVPHSCWPDGAAPKWRREGGNILRCRPDGKVEVLRDWGNSHDFAQSTLEDMYVEAILDGPHFDAHLTATDALESAAYDALDGPREQVVAELLRLERMGSGTAAEWLVATASMSDQSFADWKRHA